MSRMPLFDPPAPRTLARACDPDTSHQAATEMALSGALGRMARIAWDLLVEYPGATASELEEVSSLGDGKIRKRLNDLRKEGWAYNQDARRCLITGKMAQTWWPNESLAALMAQRGNDVE
jgi:hypothetical protein